MSVEVVHCFEDADIEVAARKMEEHQIRGLIVLDRDERRVGIASLGALAVHDSSNRLAGEAIEAVSESPE